MCVFVFSESDCWRVFLVLYSVRTEIERITPQHHDNGGAVWSSLSNCLWPRNWRRTLEAGGGPFTRQSLLDLSSMQLLNTSHQKACACVRRCASLKTCRWLALRYNTCEPCRYLWIRHHRLHNLLAFDVLWWTLYCFFFTYQPCALPAVEHRFLNLQNVHKRFPFDCLPYIVFLLLLVLSVFPSIFLQRAGRWCLVLFHHKGASVMAPVTDKGIKA